MTLALRTQHAAYTQARARIWPAKRAPFVAPKRAWTAPQIAPVYETLEQRIAAILVEVERPEYLMVHEVIAASAKVFGIPVEHLLGRRKIHPHVIPRQVAMTIARHKLHAKGRGTFASIGRVFSRDHTTIICAVRKYRKTVEAVAATLRSP